MHARGYCTVLKHAKIPCMQPIEPGHPFAQACARYHCECELDNGLGLAIVRFGDANIAFHGDTEQFLTTMSQKRHYKMLPKMVYLAKMGASPTFMVDKPMLWTERMMKLECDRMTDPQIMLTRFFAIAATPAGTKMKESANALICAFRPTGFRYNCEGKGPDYTLDVSLAYDLLFVRRVFTLSEIAEQFQLPTDVLIWMGEVGSPTWWTAMRDIALSRNSPLPELELPDLDFA